INVLNHTLSSYSQSSAFMANFDVTGVILPATAKTSEPVLINSFCMKFTAALPASSTLLAVTTPVIDAGDSFTLGRAVLKLTRTEYNRFLILILFRFINVLNPTAVSIRRVLHARVVTQIGVRNSVQLATIRHHQY